MTALDGDPGLAQSVEDLTVEQLIAKAGVEALDVVVLPRPGPRSWHRQARSIPARPWRRTPVRCRTGCERERPGDEEVGQNVDHIDRLELAGDTDR